MPRRTRFALFAVLALAAMPAAAATIRRSGTTWCCRGTTIGICMNQWSADFMVLPPFNNLQAQVVKRGTLTTGRNC
ncbi:MAG: hypothetical protein U0704_00165 [Candidatus Eisenbacteria bacterium]